jgi:glutamate synthase domain-containing protein 2/glutamate synthase domain-containing protein 1/glutamate synthase domain-containing protein 3
MKDRILHNYARNMHNYPAEAPKAGKPGMPRAGGFYDPADERDACGLGIIADLGGRPSHAIVADALTVLRNLEHRGAVGGDRKTGDGAGILCQIPERFFREEMSLGAASGGARTYGLGVFFLPASPLPFAAARSLVERAAKAEGFELLAWRDVPTLPQVLGEKAGKSLPRICQAAFAKKGADGALLSGEALERSLYILRKVMEGEAREAGMGADNFYIPSLSSRTIVYKGMFVASQFASFYPDLGQESFESTFAVVHQRYSTNTFPSWPLAQPFRMISHNGEINTLRKNINAMRARQAALESPLFDADIAKILPVIDESGSDSAMFDNVFELLVRSGRPLEQVFMMMVPEPHGADFGISRDRKAFYEYHAALMEGWDGPAAMTFTDGLKVGAALDRNGLRPFRYSLTRSGRFVGASEAGVLDQDESDILEKGMLKPGRMLLIDMEEGRLVKDREIKSRVCRENPYRRWLEKSRIELRGLFSAADAAEAGVDSSRLADYFRYDDETAQTLKPMLLTGQEAISAMGTRKPPAALSRKPVLLYSYFRQLFAQVTNPPIDPYRENLVMSLENYIGKEKNLLEESPAHCRQLKLLHPLLSNTDIRRLRESRLPDFRVATVSMLMATGDGGASNAGAAGEPGSRLAAAIASICAEAERNIDEGASLIVLSDRGVDKEKAAVPALLAASAVHSHLVKARKRHMTGLVVETGEAREIHHIAVLLGCGASGVNPWMVFERIPELLAAASGGTASQGAASQGAVSQGSASQNSPTQAAGLSVETVSDNYMEAVKKGILKILSKLGISTISSYRGSRLFEVVGLSEALLKDYFAGAESRFGGIGIAEIEADVLENHRRVFGLGAAEGAAAAVGRALELPWPPRLAALLTKAVRKGDPEAWRGYADGMDDPTRQPFAFRDLFTFKPGTAIPLESVMSVREIISRFSVAAMSCGAISREAHEALAAGANSVGAWTDSGEGGEDVERCGYADRGMDSRSASRQVASGRFGVTARYAAESVELQIKIAQGAKPGEGGQLPGAKVDAYIAKLRHATPGKTLISPPPHHDIYSIEDLSQLIHDLRCVNPGARIAVKLAAQAGIGAVAAGVAKAGADCVIVSSGDGGTGAAPLSSLDYVGNAWEAALPEIRQVLAMNGLDASIVVQVDGRLRTARDVVIAAILGAREFAFGTAALLSMGCVACGKCNLDRCPVGIATQDPGLRAKFEGQPEHIAAFFRYIAEDVRSILASLGSSSLDEVAGRWELLDFGGRAATERERLLGFDKIVAALEIARRYPLDEEGDTDGSGPPVLPLPKAGLRRFNGENRPPFAIPDPDAFLIERCAGAAAGGRVEAEMPLRNADRSIGAALSGALIRSGASLAPDAVRVRFTGTAGQSFGAFLVAGIDFSLSGEANDFLGKSLSGGRIVVRPRDESRFQPERNVIAGNVCLFGATGGEAFLSGQVGERFCVRNSGALAVAEGCGDHACEYMTGGQVVILGRTGINFGAGMSGGTAYVLDEDQLFDTRCNLGDVDLGTCAAPEEAAFLKSILARHHMLTGSPRAKFILSDWEEYLPLFVKVTPR